MAGLSATKACLHELYLLFLLFYIHSLHYSTLQAYIINVISTLGLVSVHFEFGLSHK